MEDRVGSHRCRCLLGYDGRTCDSFVQILTNTLDQKRVIFANVTDLSFSSLYSFDNVTIEYLAYDSICDTLYFSSEIGYELFEIRVAVGYNESRIVFGELQCMYI
ncbi:uncharacterized protein LOC121429536 [Lytechinus variegatus]|uniref:uncharacterized protein LOC121429536 n=1 Tax=Lytechinus variegatus TaxID=7654 RepID=UPI001BB13E87|nr:uncharacterized protein LOC121429536 [Lytechinus variegatus]